MRFAGRIESSSRLSTRGSIDVVVDRSGVSTSRHREACLMSTAFASVRYFSVGTGRTPFIRTRASSAVRAESPSTPSEIGLLAPREESSMSTWTTLASGDISRPCRMVHMFKVQPQPIIRSAPAMSSAVSGDEKPPEMPRLKVSPLKSPLATAEVATSAPLNSARARIESRAPRPPRPATNTGRSACRRS